MTQGMWAKVRFNFVIPGLIVPFWVVCGWMCVPTTTSPFSAQSNHAALRLTADSISAHLAAAAQRQSKTAETSGERKGKVDIS